MFYEGNTFNMFVGPQGSTLCVLVRNTVINFGLCVGVGGTFGFTTALFGGKTEVKDPKCG